jgi:hypothetical protein
LDLERAFIDATCPGCSYQFGIQLIDVRLQARVFCPCCKYGIQLADKDASTFQAIEDIERALREFGS